MLEVGIYKNPYLNVIIDRKDWIQGRKWRNKTALKKYVFTIVQEKK